VTFIEPPKILPHMQVVQAPQIRMPVISSYTSISTGTTRNRISRRFALSGNQPKTLAYVIAASK